VQSHPDERGSSLRVLSKSLDTRRVPPEQEALRQSWLRHARLGIALSVVLLAQIGFYAWLAHPSERAAMLYATLVAAAFTVVAAALSPIAIRRPWRVLFFLIWSVAMIAFILTASALDGGDQSPITPALFLPLLYAALGFPTVAVLTLGALDVVGYVSLAFFENLPSNAYTTVVAASIAVATLMATQAAVSRSRSTFELATLTERLHEQATRDALTGVLNRRGFDVAIEREIERARRYAHPIALLFVDVDWLKEINDRRGHAAGDRAITAVADALTEAARRTDLVARLGGDEFAVVAPETASDAALALARRIHAGMPPAGVDRVTVSIGVFATGHPGSRSEMLRAADRALYAAKDAGRNCTRAYVGPAVGEEMRPA